jgi:hypothetical protein
MSISNFFNPDTSVLETVGDDLDNTRDLEIDHHPKQRGVDRVDVAGIAVNDTINVTSASGVVGITRFVLVFGMLLAMAVMIRTTMPGMALSDSQSESVAPIAPQQPIYRPELWNLF